MRVSLSFSFGVKTKVKFKTKASGRSLRCKWVFECRDKTNSKSTNNNRKQHPLNKTVLGYASFPYLKTLCSPVPALRHLQLNASDSKYVALGRRSTKYHPSIRCLQNCFLIFLWKFDTKFRKKYFEKLTQMPNRSVTKEVHASYTTQFHNPLFGLPHKIVTKATEIHKHWNNFNN